MPDIVQQKRGLFLQLGRVQNIKRYTNDLHTVNLGSEMVEAKHVSGKNIFWSTLTVKSRGGKIFEFVHCPFL